jgi:NTE family protein
MFRLRLTGTTPRGGPLLEPGIALLLSLALGGCSLNAYTNKRSEPPTSQPGKEVVPKAAIRFAPEQERGNEKALVILALSGGGSRAAYWSGSSMVRLGKVFGSPSADLLKQVDAISSVSGGSMPAAYYAISSDPEDPGDRAATGRIWDEPSVKKLMSLPFRSRWLASWWWPYNAARYWFTAFDRSDLMAQVLADNLFDNPYTGIDLRFRDLNPERPYLLLNATTGSVPASAATRWVHGDPIEEHAFGSEFTFSAEQFEALGSDLADYEIARAVMASASFPGVFNYMTLKDYRNTDTTGREQFQHLFDGGNTDNLGLDTAERIIEANQQRYDSIVVMLVDAYTEPRGISSAAYDARKGVSYLLDTNFMDSYDSLLNKARQRSLWNFSEKMRALRNKGKSVIFYHLKFDNLKDVKHRALLRRINQIKTDFNIDAQGVKDIDQAVELLLTPSNPCLQRIKSLVLEGQPDPGDPWCTHDLTDSRS